MKPEKRLLRPPNPERTPLGLACVWSFISEETKRGVRPHCLSQALHSPLASMSARVCVCVYAQECVCVCVFNALKMVRSLACLVTIPTSLPVFLRVKAPLLSRFLLQLLGRRPALLPARRPPPHDPASLFLLGSVSEAADRLTSRVLFCDTNAGHQLLPRRPLVSVETNATVTKTFSFLTH